MERQHQNHRPSLWLLEFIHEGQAYYMVEQAQNAEHARRRFRNAWRDDRLYPAGCEIPTHGKVLIRVQPKAEPNDVPEDTSTTFAETTIETFEEAFRNCWVEKLNDMSLVFTA